MLSKKVLFPRCTLDDRKEHFLVATTQVLFQSCTLGSSVHQSVERGPSHSQRWSTHISSGYLGEGLPERLWSPAAWALGPDQKELGVVSCQLWVFWARGGVLWHQVWIIWVWRGPEMRDWGVLSLQHWVLWVLRVVSSCEIRVSWHITFVSCDCGEESSLRVRGRVTSALGPVSLRKVSIWQ